MKKILKNSLNNEKLFPELIFPAFVVLIGGLTRLIPHAPNFTAVGSASLFAGAHLKTRYSLLIPLIIMLATDLFIGFYEFFVMVSVYACFLFSWMLGVWLRKDARWSKIVISSLSSSFVFFAVTNLAVWAFTEMYPKNFSGLLSCYAFALPFFKNTLLGDLFYSGAFFGIYKLAVEKNTAYNFLRKKFFTGQPAFKN